jgi:hypothetical protein
MKKVLLATMLLLAAFLFPDRGSASSAWWMLCDSCTTDQAFRYQALVAPGSYSPIYVTNRDTNETRKFERFTSVEDFHGALVRRTEVVPAEFAPGVEAVFRQVVLSGNEIFAIIPRNDLAGLVPGVDRESSVVGDLAGGSLRASFINAFILEIERRGLLPTHESINVEAGVETPIAGANYGQGGTIRKRDLSLVIQYDDGSTISVVRRPDGTFILWEALDGNETVIPLDAPTGTGSVPVDPEAFGGTSFHFGGGRDNRVGAEALRDAIGVATGGGIRCTANTTLHGIELTCPRRQ